MTARVSIAPAVQSVFGACAEPRYAATRAAHEIIAACSSSSGGLVYTSAEIADVEALKELVDEILVHARFQGVVSPNRAADKQHSRDGYGHYLDREKC